MDLIKEDCEKLWGKDFVKECVEEAKQIIAESPRPEQPLSGFLVLAVAIAKVKRKTEK